MVDSNSMEKMDILKQLNSMAITIFEKSIKI